MAAEKDPKKGPPYFLSSEELLLVQALVDVIVPVGEGPGPEPGGLAVGAHNYFDSRMLDLPVPARQLFRSALHLVDAKSDRRFGKNFVALSSSDRRTLLRSLLLDPETMPITFALRAICLEGFYSDYHDPNYSGRTAWDIVEFKGKRIDGVKKDWSFLKIYRDAGGGG